MEVEFFLLIISILFFASILSDKVSNRFGIPALVLFLLVGMLFGSDGVGLEFDNHHLAQAIGSVSLCIILFSGGMDTKLADIKPVIREGALLATVGVLLTAVFTGIIIFFLMKWTHGGVQLALPTALLMAATMSSTDSASVFSILRGKGLSLKHNLKPMLELESGSNDPMAAILTTSLIGVVNAAGEPNILWLIFSVILQLLFGFLAGFLLGKFLVWMMNKVNIENESLYPILVLTSCLFIFSVTYFINGNPFLAVYIGGLVFGNSKFAHKRYTRNFFEGWTWICQLTMFLTLGLLVNPHELLDTNVLILGGIVSVVMIFVSRPVSVALCLAPFRTIPHKAKLFVCWVGLKGASPILFSIMCLAANVPNARLIFNVVFLCTFVSLIVQGMSLNRMAQWLGVANEPKQKLNRVENFDIDLPEEIKSAATEITITDDMLVKGKLLMNIGLPQNTLAIMVKRTNNGEEQFFVPTGKSELRPADKLLVITDDQASLAQMYQDLEENKHKQLNWLDDTWEMSKIFIDHFRTSRRLNKKSLRDRIREHRQQRRQQRQQQKEQPSTNQSDSHAE